ncbi:MAG: hypothetical protein QOJ53_2486 [Sphingomonadales bacterium]|nr:hypothetical protein [Sphingomonadales bacterium]
MPSNVSEQRQAGASEIEVPAAMVAAGVEVLRGWMNENWSDIRDNAEPGIKEVVRELLLHGRSGSRPLP